MARHSFSMYLQFCFFAISLALRISPRDLNTSVLDCYDYIIVGGGVSGLVVANRLTEDPDVTVLVLESGPLDNYEDFIMNPDEDGDGLGSIYDWNLWTAPQIYLDGASRPYGIGRGVGGSSLINGMCWTRGGREDYDAWETLGNEGWGWDGMLPYFMKTEHYTHNVEVDFSSELYIYPDVSIHGYNGYVQVSYARFFYNQSQSFLDGLQELGIPILTDPNNGTAAGGMLIPSSLDPNSQTRSDARTAYFDGFINSRPNFHVATGQLVTRITTDQLTSNTTNADKLWITGVQYISDRSLETHNVSCFREVILAAGAVHSPQLLELSGIGSTEILNQFGIPVQIDLPGVGNNFQDHPMVEAFYFAISNASYLTTRMKDNNSVPFNQTVQVYFANRAAPWTAGAINTVAFPSLTSISPNWTNMMADASTQSVTQYLPAGLDPTIIAGYAAQKLLLVDLLSSKNVGAYELLNANDGLLAVSAMHPFSRGGVHIQSTDPLQQPSIDPRYCSNPLDCQLWQPQPYSPFFQGATPDTLMPAIQSGLRTEFHGTGSTSMMPLQFGGVVDSHLRVYGTQNLRIVDAGIFPLVPAAHLQASVYAVAEKAADIIKSDNLGVARRGDCSANSTLDQAGQVNSDNSLLSNVSSYPNNSTYSNTSTWPNISTNTTWPRPQPRPPFSNFPQYLNSSLLNWTDTDAPQNGSGNLFTAVQNGPIFTLAQGPDPRVSVIAAAVSMFLNSTFQISATSAPSRSLPLSTLLTLLTPNVQSLPTVIVRVPAEVTESQVLGVQTSAVVGAFSHLIWRPFIHP